MDTFLLETFHLILEGDLNPFTNKRRAFNQLLHEQVESGAKLLSYNHTYFTEDNIEYVAANSYWFKGLHDIYPMYSRQQISKERYPGLLTRVRNLPAGRKVLNTFQYYPGQIELVLEVDHEQLTTQEARFYYYNLLMSQEYGKVIGALNKKLFALSEEGALARYIRNIQSLLERYLQAIDADYNPTASLEWHLLIDQEFDEQDIFKLMKQYLQGMIHHLYINYRQYLRLDSHSYYFLRRVALKHKAIEINAIYEALSFNATDEMLKEVIEGLLSSFADRECIMPLSSLCTFEILVDRLHVILKENKDQSDIYVSELIADVMLREGVNSAQFVQYLIRQNESVMQYLDGPERREFLKERIRKYKNLNSLGQTVYNSNYVAVGEALLSWCKKQVSINKSEEPVKSAGKFCFTGSVPELAALFRGLHEAGLIHDMKGAGLSRAVTDLFNTNRVKQISSQSFYNKFQTIDHKAASRIQQHFQTAIDRLNDLKG